MISNEFLLSDRIQKVQQIINKYGEDNFYISFSGGKDSIVVSHLLDIAIPGNKIPRVFCNTGIEYNLMVDFVKSLAETDERFVIIKPSIPINKMLAQRGYPFKSKEHSALVNSYQQTGHKKWVDRYLTRGGLFGCPEKLKYQFTDDFNIKISDKCCDELKKKPLHQWQKEHNKKCAITGLMRAEGGRRSNVDCIVLKDDNIIRFHPLAPMSEEWEEWFINNYNIKLCSLYYEPYNFKRTGCKGCPFNPNLKEDLETLEIFFPNERKQCEIIWHTVYEEYRRISFRLRSDYDKSQH